MKSDLYHEYYEKEQLWRTTNWLGVPCWKLPMDAWIIQELIYRLQPDYLVETGTNHGGSSLFYASIMELIKHGQVISIDVKQKVLPTYKSKHIMERITYLHGDSTDRKIVEKVHSIVKGKNNMVVLDSWHTKNHVVTELECYAWLVPKNFYVIVEDTHTNGNPIEWEWGEGPMEAVLDFMEFNHDEFIIDKECERLGMTFNPNGYIRRIK